MKKWSYKVKKIIFYKSIEFFLILLIKCTVKIMIDETDLI